MSDNHKTTTGADSTGIVAEFQLRFADEFRGLSDRLRVMLPGDEPGKPSAYSCARTPIRRPPASTAIGTRARAGRSDGSAPEGFDYRHAVYLRAHGKVSAPAQTASGNIGLNRVVAVRGELVFSVTDHAHFIALDRFTDELVWDTEVDDYREHYGAVVAPLVVGDLVIVVPLPCATSASRSLSVAAAYTVSRMQRCPHKPDQLTGHGHRCDRTGLVLGQPPEAATQPPLGLIGQRNHPPRLSTAGATSGAGTFTLTPVDDADDESDERVMVTGETNPLPVTGT